MAIAKRLNKKIWYLFSFLLNKTSLKTRYIAKHNIGLNETWVMNGVGSKTLAFLKGAIISNHIR